MSELFGVSTGYLLKDELDEERIISNECFGVSSEPLKKVTIEEANIFLDMKRKGSKVVANATSMCILSPVLLIILGTMTEDHMAGCRCFICGNAWNHVRNCDYSQ